MVDICPKCGKPTVWSRAGNIDMLTKTYGAQFFSGIFVLALVCPETELLRRMKAGRGISDPDWLESSVGYNCYFMEHDAIGDVTYDLLNVSGMTAQEAALQVERWLQSVQMGKRSGER